MTVLLPELKFTRVKTSTYSKTLTINHLLDQRQTVLILRCFITLLKYWRNEEDRGHSGVRICNKFFLMLSGIKVRFTVHNKTLLFCKLLALHMCLNVLKLYIVYVLRFSCIVIYPPSWWGRHYQWSDSCNTWRTYVVLWFTDVPQTSSSQWT